LTCSGFEVHDGACYLLKDTCGQLQRAEGVDTYPRSEGEACTDFHDYTNSAADVELSDRVEGDAHYVLSPGPEAKLEVQVNRGQKGDRVAIMDGFAACGVSAPSADVQAKWLSIEPEGPWDEHVPIVPPPREAVHFKNDTDNMYCLGNNLRPAEMGLEKHQCYNKCHLDDSHPGCSGYHSILDSPTSNALCLSEEECRLECTYQPDCWAIDMHKFVARCFFNNKTCVERSDVSAPDPDYKILVKDPTGGDGRRLEHWHKSWMFKSSLTFGPIPLVAGTFNVCFCDAERSACTSWADFRVRAGTLHVSGVSCLLSVPRLRSAECQPTPQGHGLYCLPSAPEPPAERALEQIPTISRS
jgi:hypothetical protein